MTIPTITTASLKKAKNAVIGNPLAKLTMASDEVFMRALAESIYPPASASSTSTTTPASTPQESKDSLLLRTEAAHVVASLAYGSDAALSALVRAGALHAVLVALAGVRDDIAIASGLSLETGTPRTSTTEGGWEVSPTPRSGISYAAYPPTPTSTSAAFFPSSPASSSHTHAPSHFPPAPSSKHPNLPTLQTLQSALARALKAICAALADIVGPAMWGMRREPATPTNPEGKPEGTGTPPTAPTPPPTIPKTEARDILESVFTPSNLDILLPLLVSPSPSYSSSSAQTALSITLLIAYSIRTPSLRNTVTSWHPPSPSPSSPGPSASASTSPTSTSTKRGWETISATAAATSPISPTTTQTHSRGWEKQTPAAPSPSSSPVLKTLVALLGSSTSAAASAKMVEGALMALAALVKDSLLSAGAASTSGAGWCAGMALSLVREPSPNQPSVLQTVLGLTKSRNADVQLAACLCATHIIRAIPHPHSSSPLSATSSSSSSSSQTTSALILTLSSAAFSLINVLANMLGETSRSPGTAAGAGSGRNSPGLSGWPATPSSAAPAPRAYLQQGLMLRLGVGYGGSGNGNGSASAGAGGSGMGTPPSTATLESFESQGVTSTNAKLNEFRTKACFVLYYLITDDPALCSAAYDRGCLERIAAIVREVMPPEVLGDGTLTPGGSANVAAGGWEDEEPESVVALREAALTALAAISLFDNDIRRALTDDLLLLPAIGASLKHPHAGVRYAACQCVRALSRAVAVLRTNIVDSGLGMGVFAILMGGKGKEKEGGVRKEFEWKREDDRRVLYAALGAVCNIVNEFSPLRPIYLEQGLVPRLVEILQSGDPGLRLNALWAVKNLVRKSSTETKRDVMGCLGWARIVELLDDFDMGVRDQALNVLRNLAENEDGIDMIFKEIGPAILLENITRSLQSDEEDIVLQAAYVLANISNGSESQQNHILSHQTLLVALRTCIAESKADVRRPAVACVLELARTNPKRRKALADAGIVSTLRHLSDWTGAGVVAPPATPSVSRMPSSPGVRSNIAGSARSGHGPRGLSWGGVSGFHGNHFQHSTIIEDEKDVVDQARTALDWLEHGEIYTA